MRWKGSKWKEETTILELMVFQTFLKICLTSVVWFEVDIGIAPERSSVMEKKILQELEEAEDWPKMQPGTLNNQTREMAQDIAQEREQGRLAKKAGTRASKLVTRDLEYLNHHHCRAFEAFRAPVPRSSRATPLRRS